MGTQKISINPPPADKKCECCGRHISELKLFKDGKLLMKTFRDFCGCVGASWECWDCIGLNDKEYYKMKNKDELTKIMEEKLDKIKEEKELIIKRCPYCKSDDTYKSNLREGFEYRCNSCGEYIEKIGERK